ncbi:MAG: hypothetical protein Q8J63_04255 [Candidatus Aquicultor sp.]|nr:hypothetical protein [Candidatus Aquicultor sp.]
MDKKFLIGGGAIACCVVAVAIAVALSASAPQKASEDGAKKELAEEQILTAKTEALLKQCAFYKGEATVFEKQSWKSRGTDGSSGKGDATLVSEEILIYDKRTDKSYILGRSLSYESRHTVIVNLMNGDYLNTGNISASGALTEYYGTGLLMKADIKDASASANPQYVLDFGMNPMRMDNKQKLFYTQPQTNKEDWVTYVSTAETTRMGSGRVFAPDEHKYEILNLVPGLSEISDSKGYNANETYAHEATDRFWVPVGTLSYDYKKVTYEEAIEALAEIKDDAEFEELCEELAKNQPPAWKKTAILADDIGAIATAAQRIDASIEHAIPENYRDRGNKEIALDTISESPVLKESLNKLRNDIDAVQGDQGSPRKLTGFIMETSTDSEGGAEQKNLKKKLDVFLPLLNDLFLEYDSYHKALQKNIEEARAYAKMKDGPPEDKVVALLKDCLKNAKSLKNANSCLNTMLADIQIALTDLNKVENAGNEARYRELNKLYDLWAQTLKDFKTGAGAGAGVDFEVDVERGVSLPEGYPVDVIQIIDGAIVAMSEIIKEEPTAKEGFAVALKTDLTPEEALRFYKTSLKNVPGVNSFNISGISTLTGRKSGYDFSIMVMKNSLGGKEKTVVQIALTPIS